TPWPRAETGADILLPECNSFTRRRAQGCLTTEYVNVGAASAACSWIRMRVPKLCRPGQARQRASRDPAAFRDADVPMGPGSRCARPGRHGAFGKTKPRAVTPAIRAIRRHEPQTVASDHHLVARAPRQRRAGAGPAHPARWAILAYRARSRRAGGARRRA